MPIFRRCLVWFLLASVAGPTPFLRAATAYSETRAAERRAETARTLHPSLGRGLGLIVATYHDLAGQTSNEDKRVDLAIRGFSHVQRDRRHRILVDIYLDAGQTALGVRHRVRKSGGRLLAQVNWYRNGLVTAWMPIKKIARLGSSHGISAVNLAIAPRINAGKTTSQGVVVHHTDTVNTLGYLGAGVTVGVISDSYNFDTADASDPGFTRAPADVTSGDLPGTTNTAGYTTPVNVIAESTSASTDEGRAMLQIIHDLAPAAKLAFASDGNSESTMATNIGLLQSSAGCKVICDDVIFFSEPMFSDGVIAQAVDQATRLGVVYFSAAGNNGNSGYAADFNPVAATTGSTQATAEGVVVSTISSPERSAIAQWHAFGTDSGGNPIVVQNITTGADTASLDFQWDDPFDAVGGLTADFDILVFNANGTYQTRLSSTDSNNSTGEPIELSSADLSANTSYKICIVLTNRIAVPPQASHLRYVAISSDVITGDDITATSPTTFGHSCAATAVGVAAYDYDIIPGITASHTFKSIPEDFSSNGPVEIYFDSAGKRLASGLLRKQPTIAAVDGVNTSFFPPSPKGPSANDFEGDGFPNFSGTSAATPHAAAIAALLINAAAAKGMGALAPADIRSILINSTRKTTDQDPNFCSATAGPVTVTASGDTTNASADSPNFFHVSYTGTSGQLLTQITIDLSPVSLHFDTSVSAGLPFTLGTTTGAPSPAFSGTPTLGAGATGSSSAAKATVNFSNFNSGDTLNFGIDRDEDLSNSAGNGADEIGGFIVGGGGTITATVNGVTYHGTFTNQLGGAYNAKVGYGLLDASAALNYLIGL